MTHLIAGCTHINDLVYADGRTVTAQLGGSIYAVNGIKTYYDDLLFVTTAGPDFDAYFGDYYRTNQISNNGVHQVLPHTQYNMLAYQPDGRWREYSKYGPTFEEQWSATTLIQATHILPFANDHTEGIYLESSVTEPIWANLDAVRVAAPHATVMWEVATSDVETPARHAAVTTCLSHVDMYSINLPEALALFGVANEADALAAIITQDTPCLFRVGTKGAYMVADGQAWFAPSYDLEYSVDPTGCGNCATGASLYGMAEGLHPLHTVILANLAAALNARQYGPYPAYTAAIRAEQLHRAEGEFVRLLQDQIYVS